MTLMQTFWSTRTQVIRLSLGLALWAAVHALAQTSNPTPATAPALDALAQAQIAISKQDWAKAESLLLPISESQPRNPFVFYEMARVYENTNRIDAARQIYQGLINIPDARQRQYALVVRTPEVSYLTSLVSLSQARLNALNASAPQTPAVAQVTVTPRTAAPSPSSSPSSNKVGVNAMIGSALQSWATAWANKDLPGYFNHYVSNFQGEMRSQAAWKKHRTEYILGKKTIALDLSDVQVNMLSDTKLQAHFKQSYTSDSYVDRSSKTLSFTKVGERWLIERETTK